MNTCAITRKPIPSFSSEHGPISHNSKCFMRCSWWQNNKQVTVASSFTRSEPVRCRVWGMLNCDMKQVPRCGPTFLVWRVNLTVIMRLLPGACLRDIFIRKGTSCNNYAENIMQNYTKCSRPGRTGAWDFRIPPPGLLIQDLCQIKSTHANRYDTLGAYLCLVCIIGPKSGRSSGT
jgi:hypothetical protein